ncbi:MAG: sulfatase-like hydrolase/transferase [Spirochaetia bacterium]|jgi:arylsulfatase A-like enzyme|nr:sulfatase-like hydrolase/transferase [Spirochaetia bacterium]
MKTPNILFITTDQQRKDTLGYYGYPQLKTPHLDALAADGKLFSNAYSPNPACIPARHGILTGLPSRFHGFDHNYFNDEKHLPYNIPAFPNS